MPASLSKDEQINQDSTSENNISNIISDNSANIGSNQTPIKNIEDKEPSDYVQSPEPSQLPNTDTLKKINEIDSSNSFTPNSDEDVEPNNFSEKTIPPIAEPVQISINDAEDVLISLRTFIANVKDREEYRQKQSWLEQAFIILQEQSWDSAKEEASEILYKWGHFLISIGQKEAGLLRFWKLYEKFPGTKWYQQVFEELVAMEKTEDMLFIPKSVITLGENGIEYQLQPYFIDTYLVTNAKYYDFIKETGYKTPSNWLGDIYPVGKANHPVTWVNLEDALTYATWSGKRLPTEMEWENAAKGPESYLWPWGNFYESNRCNCHETGIGDTTPIGHYPNGQSYYHGYDFAGNVWQWTDSIYQNNRHYHILRGGSWFTLEQFSTTVYRYFDFITSRKAIYGFRCAKTFGNMLKFMITSPKKLV